MITQYLKILKDMPTWTLYLQLNTSILSHDHEMNTIDHYRSYSVKDISTTNLNKGKDKGIIKNVTKHEIEKLMHQ